MTKDQTTLALLGWIPARNVLSDYLYNVNTRQTCSYKGFADGGVYAWLQDAGYPEMPIEWDRLPSHYAALCRYVVAEQQAGYEHRSYG